MTEIKQIADRLYDIECEYEEKEHYNEQSIRVGQRIRALLNIYAQIIYEDRVFEEEYLKEYLGR